MAASKCRRAISDTDIVLSRSCSTRCRPRRDRALIPVKSRLQPILARFVADPTGKSLRFIGSRFGLCQAASAKILRFRISENHDCICASRSSEGRTRRHERGARDAMDAIGARRAHDGRTSKGVWSRSPDAGINLAGRSREATVARKPGTPRRARISRKPLRGECRLFRPNLCCLRAQCAFSLHARLVGAASIRCSPRPLVERVTNDAWLGHFLCRENVATLPLSCPVEPGM